MERLHSRPESRILDFAAGSGRNAEALRRAGFAVVAIDDDAAASEQALEELPNRFDAVVSTHGLLHGSCETIASRVRRIAAHLEPGGLFYATFGSTRDARFGLGERIDDSTFAPLDGDERGVAHVYFDRQGVLALLDPHFEVESIEEHGVDDVAGSWAHRERALRGAAHWFAIARKP
jgi:SAM-dependent methyltransferase